MSDVPRIRIADIHKSFGPLEVLRGVSFDVHRGSVVSVIGASGSGKSTLLRCVNHLEPPDSGEVYIEGEPLGSRVDARGQRRPSFVAAAPAEQAKNLYEEFAEALRRLEITVATGVFGATMSVELVNEGPVTILLDSDKTF